MLLVVALSAALSVDVVQAGYGIKSDEATYVTMALSLAYDHDAVYQRRDLERFWGLYHTGPEGIFLKTGPKSDRLYFGKSLIYPFFAAPFVWLLGLNGMLVFNVLLLFVVCVCGYIFLSARSAPAPALLFTLAFVGATVVPVYAVMLMPEIFNFTLVFVAYFLWLYKEVAPPGGFRFLRSFRSDVAAAALLGLATYSKPAYAPLIGPIGLLWLWRRQLRPAVVVGVVFVAVTVAGFGVTALQSGDWNYQGGNRKSFYSGHAAYSGFPYESPAATFDSRGGSVTTNDTDAQTVLKPSEFVNRFVHNVEYFFLGRHHGFVPYFFPGAVILLLWLVSRERWAAWRVVTLVGFVVAVTALLVWLPYTWNGGGGPPGNRYFLPMYPILFFVTPPLASSAPALLAWVGGALFTAKMLINPFVAAKFTWEAPEHGFARKLPVELTIANDLPVMLDTSIRGRVLYTRDPTVLLYFLDKHAYPPEPDGMWIAGDGRADIIFRTDYPVRYLNMRAHSPIHTVLTVSAGRDQISVPVTPGKETTLQLPVSGVRGLNSYAYLLHAQSSQGFVPHLLDPSSNDNRNLGVQISFTPVFQ